MHGARRAPLAGVCHWLKHAHAHQPCGKLLHAVQRQMCMRAAHLVRHTQWIYIKPARHLPCHDLQAIGFSLVPLMPSVWSLTALYFVVCFSYNFTNSAVFTSLAWMFPKRAGGGPRGGDVSWECADWLAWVWYHDWASRPASPHLLDHP